TLPPNLEPDIVPEDIPIEIVYEDDQVLVINKRKGMVVHPAPGNYTGTVVNGIMHHCKDSLSSINGVKRPGIVHRIDKDTTGLLMIAKTDKAHQSLAAQLEKHTITRGYQAIVYHNLKEDTGKIDLPIGRDPKNRLRMAVVDTGGKRAVTNYRVLERLGKYTLIEARLETGRTHQIRVHLSRLKHPLLGDSTYGPEKNPYGIKGQLLHAYLLGFEHPTTGEYLEFKAELPEEFTKVLEKMRGKK
ncbi:MAG: RluA family pseudouridine synthase, partial [Anaerovoracaceae bacterium]